MEAELVTILGEAGRPGIFLSVKLREGTAGAVLLLPGGWEDATYKDFASNHSLLAKYKFMSSICVSRSSCKFLPRMSSGFFPYPFLPFLYLCILFCNSSVLGSFSITAFLPLFDLHTL